MIPSANNMHVQERGRTTEPALWAACCSGSARSVTLTPDSEPPFGSSSSSDARGDAPPTCV